MPAYATILLSQQHLYPCARTPWVANSMRALHFIRQQRWSLVSSVGMTTWEFLTCRAADLAIPLTLVLDDPSANDADVRSRYSLPDETRIVIPDGLKDASDRAARAKIRDETVLSLVDTIMPVSIRPGGKLETLLTRHRGGRTQVMSHFAAPYDREPGTAGYTLSADALSDQARNLDDDYPLDAGNSRTVADGVKP